MKTKDPTKYTPIRKNIGITSSEKYLGELCEKTFLSLWSYPGVYRDIDKLKDKGHGKEICDLLVVFGQHILIFSDKDCKLQKSDDISLDWQRWFRSSIHKSAQQVWGAERWIKQNTSRIYLDRECKRLLPLDLPEMENAKFHLIVVAHGISERIKELHGGSGSLMIDSSIQGLVNHFRPFTVGDLDPAKTFVHVLDDDSLNTLMSTRDTIFDFVEYLEKRELLLRNKKRIFTPGEEELLAIYLTKMNNDSKHDFNFPSTFIEKDGSINFKQGLWAEFERNPRRIAQIEHDKVSYVWDDLIETFNRYAIEGNQYFVTAGGVKDTERILRFMASEPRVIRRLISQVLMEIINTTSKDQRRLRILDPINRSGTHYVLLLFPVPVDETISYETYREVRREFLRVCCLGTKLQYDHAKDIVGIATESGLNSKGRSEDAIYFDARLWNEELKQEALELLDEYNILKAPNYGVVNVQEFPDIP